MSKQNIYIAMGSLAYAIAKSDGQIQEEEKNIIRRTAEEVLFNEDIPNDFIDNIFDVMEKENINVEDAYKYALDILESNRYEYDFYDSLKSKCIRFMELIANAFQGTSNQEQDLIERFKKDLERFN